MFPSLKFLLATLLVISYNVIIAQQFTVTQQNGGGCLYSLQNTGGVPTSSFFYLYGDGFYGIKNTEYRDYPNSQNNGSGGNTPYEASSFKLDPYNTNPPAKSVANTNNVPPTCSFIEPSVTLNTNPQIGSSWAVSPVSYNYMIVKARRTRTDRNSPLPTHLKFYYKSAEMVLDGNILYQNQYKNWFTTPSQQTVNVNGYDKLISLPFDASVAEDELVIAYVPLKSLKSPNYELYVAAELYSGTLVEQLFQVQGTPHDPNEMQVNEDCFFLQGTYTFEQLANLPPYRLNYKVIFQNQGTAAATNVVLKVKSDQKWDMSTVEITGSKYPCTFNVDLNGDLIITFLNIGLPGANQGPIHYTYDETQGWVKFRVCTEDFENMESWENSCFVSHTDIIFDHLQPIATNQVVTGTECSSYCFSPDFIENNNDLVIESIPCEGPDGRTKESKANIMIRPSVTDYSLEIVSDQIGQNLEIKIISMEGQIVKSIYKDKMFGSEIIDVSALPAGTYMLKISGKDINRAWKFIKM